MHPDDIIEWLRDLNLTSTVKISEDGTKLIEVDREGMATGASLQLNVPVE